MSFFILVASVAVLAPAASGFQSPTHDAQWDRRLLGSPSRAPSLHGQRRCSLGRGLSFQALHSYPQRPVRSGSTLWSHYQQHREQAQQ
jgi:hypothetical protein